VIRLGQSGRIEEIVVKDVVCGLDLPDDPAPVREAERRFRAQVKTTVKALKKRHCLIYPDQEAVKKVRIRTWFWAGEYPAGDDWTQVDCRWLGRACLFCGQTMLARTDWTSRRKVFVCHGCLGKVAELSTQSDELLALIARIESPYLVVAHGKCSFCNQLTSHVRSIHTNGVSICLHCAILQQRNRAGDLCVLCREMSAFSFGKGEDPLCKACQGFEQICSEGLWRQLVDARSTRFLLQLAERCLGEGQLELACRAAVLLPQESGGFLDGMPNRMHRKILPYLHRRGRESIGQLCRIISAWKDGISPEYLELLVVALHSSGRDDEASTLSKLIRRGD
jgi:hypothetical protein